MAVKVYSYLRFSSPKQAAGTSAARQKAYAAAWAAERGLALDESLSLRDEGLSAFHGAHVKTGALGAFLRAIEAGLIAPGSVLIVEQLDRLSREQAIQAQAQFASIISAGVRVVTVADGREYSQETLRENPMDLLYALMVMIRANEESESKSKRVVAAIKQQCLRFQSGESKRRIRAGKDPVWLCYVDNRWELIPERVEMVHFVLDQYRAGYGGMIIARMLQERNWSLTGGLASALLVNRMVKSEALAGVHTIEVGGESFRMEGYYPALISSDEFAELQRLRSERGRRIGKGTNPSIITGLRIATCGYCGSAISSFARACGKRYQERRLLCVNKCSVNQCPVGGSLSTAAIEKALLDYCGDQFNLADLLSGVGADVRVRANLSGLRQKIVEVEQQLQRVTDALAADDGAVPLAFLRKARELEAVLDSHRAEAVAAERELVAISQVQSPEMADQWSGLREGVLGLDADIRIKARKLVADTFSQIQIFRLGLQPDPKNTWMDLLLITRGGVRRYIRVNRRTGAWQRGETLAG
ncbi:MAG: recombinase family protein [Proteobacteria bacterium]|nr:recombinase family protein [Pseudomonadota bacterium]